MIDLLSPVNIKGRTSSLGIGSASSTGSKYKDDGNQDSSSKKLFDFADGAEDANTLTKQITVEEQEKIKKMIETAEEGHEEEELDNELDDYLDNLENESD